MWHMGRMILDSLYLDRNTCVEAPKTQPRDQEVLGRWPAKLGLFYVQKELLLPWLAISLEIASRRKYRRVGNLNPIPSSWICLQITETNGVSPELYCSGHHPAGVLHRGSLVVIVRILSTLSRVQSGLTKRMR